MILLAAVEAQSANSSSSSCFPLRFLRRSLSAEGQMEAQTNAAQHPSGSNTFLRNFSSSFTNRGFVSGDDGNSFFTLMTNRLFTNPFILTLDGIRQHCEPCFKGQVTLAVSDTRILQLE